uniref:Disco-interacting protein 2 homolog Ba n=1 Tax=Cyprinus carpio TaxID=7962 RepID=A0A8C2FM66_CYPCA
MADRGVDLAALPKEVREHLAELELELSEGDITQKGYEKKRVKLLAPFVPQTQNVDVSIQLTPGLSSDPTSTPNAVPVAAPRQHRAHRSGGTRDDRYRSDIHTEAVQAALARHKEAKMALPMPTKRRSAFVQSPAENCTPPGWSHFAHKPSAAPSVQISLTSRVSENTGVPAHSRVSTKIQQLLNTLKRPKRPPLSEFFLDDSEEIVEVPQPDPNTPRPEGRQIIPVKGEPLGVVSNWPPALQAALARWGATQAKSPALTALDITGKPLYTLTYGKLWSRSLKLAYTLLNKLGTKNEPVLKPGDRVALVYPNSDPGMFWVAFYGCLLAEVIPVPIEVPLSRKDAGSQQIGFLLGSCGVGLALTSEVCLKGLPKTQNGEIMQFKGWPRLKWVVTDTKYLTKPSKDWQPHIPTANTDTAYIEYKASKEGTVMGVAVSKISMLTHCQALTQACNYCEGETLVNVLDFKKDSGLWHGVLTSHGLKPEMICPCASSPEAMTVAIRRPGTQSAPLPARAILSMAGLSHGVIRVNTEDKNSALTVQDVGHVMPGALMCIVKPDGLPMLCKTDEIGEIVLNSRAGGTMYYGLPGVTKSTFELIPVNSGGTPIGDVPFTRTGLLGFVGPGSLVFVVGKIEGLLSVSGRRHNADDLVATALAVEPVKTVYRGRIAVFSVTVFYDERIVIVAEQRPDANEEDSFQWMSRVLQAIDGIHQVGLYCLALVPANTLPKTPLGGIHLSETKHHFLEGSLHPCNVLMCPHTCVTNLPKPRQKQTVGPASIMVGNLVAGKRIAQASGRDLRLIDDQEQSKKHQFLSEALQWRAQTDPDHVLYMLLNAKVTTATCSQLHKRAEKITAALLERGGINTGDNVVLLYPPGIDLIASFYGCLYAGCIPVTVRPPHPQNLAATLPTVRMIIDVSLFSSCILTTQTLMKILRSKEAAASVNVKTWPNIIDTDDLPKKRPSHIYKPPTAEMLAYLDFSVSTTGMLTGVKISHSAVNALCRSIKLQCELYSSRQIAICMDPYCGLGFVLWCMSSVYSGHQSILIPPMELETSLPLWLSTLSQYKIRDTFCSYSVMELCTKGLGTQTEALKARGVNLSCVRSCVVIAEERPRLALTQSFSKLFKDLGLSPRAVSTAFGARVNLAISGPYFDFCLLPSGHEVPPRGAPQSLPLTESGTILPGVRVIIVNPETRGPLGDSHLGEIWVSSPHNASGYYTIYGEESLQADHFNTRLSFGDTETLWARTGYLGFVTRTELLDASGDRHNALFVVGSLDETLELRGLRYHPIDIETSVSRAHRSIAESAVFTWTNLLVVVVELSGSEQEALDLVPLVTNVVLKEHHLIVGVVVIVDPGVIPINSRGEKQRMHLRDSFLADQLDPIYVAYNM